MKCYHLTKKHHHNRTFLSSEETMEKLTHSMFFIVSQITSFLFQIDWMSNGQLLHFKNGTFHSRKFLMWRWNVIFAVLVPAHQLYSLHIWIDFYLKEKLYQLLVLHGLWIAVVLACVFCFHMTLAINHNTFPDHVRKTILLTKKVEHEFVNVCETFKVFKNSIHGLCLHGMFYFGNDHILSSSHGLLPKGPLVHLEFGCKARRGR